MFDVIVIGGSYAGMAAAMPLLRARRKVAVIDVGERRNRFASHAHGILALDGKPPEVIAGEAKTQLLAYPTLQWLEGRAQSAVKTPEGFAVHTDTGVQLMGKRLILATGLRDQLPSVPGLAERWGQSVFHCPYCHAYELGGGDLGVLATSELSMHQALMLPDWGATTLFINGAFTLTDEHQQQLQMRDVALEHARVKAVEGDSLTLLLDDGRRRSLAGLFVAPNITLVGRLAQELGCQITEGPMGPLVETDTMQQTTVLHVYACGDIARAASNVTFAFADGAAAGLAAHRSLMFETLGF